MHNQPHAASRRRWLIGTGAVLLLAELGLRASGYHAEPRPEAVWQYEPAQDPMSRAGDGLHEFSARALWTPMAGAEIPWSTGERVNAAGCRGAMLATSGPQGQLRIAALGAGATFAEGVAWPDGYCARLERQLAEHGTPVEVLGAGVIGFSVEQCFERYLELVRPASPDIVILALTAVEDATPSPYLPDRAKIRITGGLEKGWSFVSKSPVLDLRLLSWSHDRLRAWSFVPVDPSPELERKERWRARQDLPTDGSDRADWSGTRRVPPVEFAARLSRLVHQVREDRGEIVFVWLPRPQAIVSASSALAEYQKLLHEVGEHEAAAVVDCGPRFQAEIARGALESELFAGARFTPAGHALLADELTTAILASRAR